MFLIYATYLCPGIKAILVLMQNIVMEYYASKFIKYNYYCDLKSHNSILSF